MRNHVPPTKPVVDVRRESCASELRALGSCTKYAKQKKQYALFFLWDLVVLLDCEDGLHGQIKRLNTSPISSVVHRVFGCGDQNLKRV